MAASDNFKFFVLFLVTKLDEIKVYNVIVNTQLYIEKPSSQVCSFAG